MLTQENHQAIDRSNLSAVGKLAARTAIASLELLKEAAVDLQVPIEKITVDDLMRWLK